MIKVHENEADFAKILESDKKVLVDFNAKWCGPCRRMGRRIEGLEEDYKDLTFLKVDTDEYPELAQKFGVVYITRMVAFKYGKRIDVETESRMKSSLAQGQSRLSVRFLRIPLKSRKRA